MKELNIKEFISEVFFPVPADIAGSPEDFRRFAWFIGAGCSKSSGIPLASELISNWETDRAIPPGEDGFDKIAERFPGRQTFQRAIENVCSRGFPTWGYYVLAQLMTHPNMWGHFNVALTTNFDDLLLTALYWYGYMDVKNRTRFLPRHVPESTLSQFIMSEDKNPIIIPLHGTAQFQPLSDNTSQEESLRSFDSHLTRILKGRALIVTGYGGNDKGIRQMFSTLVEHDSTLFSDSIYWASDKSPATNPNLAWLLDLETNHRVPVKWVRVDSFEDLMYAFVGFLMTPEKAGLKPHMIQSYRHVFDYIYSDLKLDRQPVDESGWDKWAVLQSEIRDDFKEHVRIETSHDSNLEESEVTSASDDLTQSVSSDYEKWRMLAVDILQKNLQQTLAIIDVGVSSTRTVFGSEDGKSVSVILCSREYSRKDEQHGYWFGLHGYQQTACKSADEAYVVLVCGEPKANRILRIPFGSLVEYSFTVTEKASSLASFWHLRVNEKDGLWHLRVNTPDSGPKNIDLTPYVVDSIN